MRVRKRESGRAREDNNRHTKPNTRATNIQVTKVYLRMIGHLDDNWDADESADELDSGALTLSLSHENLVSLAFLSHVF